MKLLKNKHVAIVGGGPGGLTLARLLQAKGADVKVYERDHSRNARVQGSIVDLHYESGLKAIDAAGLTEAFKASYMPGADRYRILDKHGRICYDEHNAGPAVGFGHEDFRPEIDRGALRSLLLDSLQENTVIWDSQFLSMKQAGDRWQLAFANGTGATADFVIGSDGARSKIRPYLSDSPYLYSGVTIIQGEVNDPQRDCPEVAELLNRANVMAFSDGKNVAIQPRGDGGLTFYASALYPEDWVESSGLDFRDNEAVSAYLERFYESWNAVFFRLFKASAHFVPRKLKYVPPCQHWDAQSNLTLIGDAAHLMPPSGEGVNTAMLDALDLSENLGSDEYCDLQSAIAAYEIRMRSRARTQAEEAIEGIRSMHNENALAEMIAQFEQVRP
jgi:2-polyprenyl-6-methoxyphenol hydroxylase-like FAD-dependent oxidoreductase